MGLFDSFLSNTGLDPEQLANGAPMTPQQSDGALGKMAMKFLQPGNEANKEAMARMQQRSEMWRQKEEMESQMRMQAARDKIARQVAEEQAKREAAMRPVSLLSPPTQPNLGLGTPYGNNPYGV